MPRKTNNRTLLYVGFFLCCFPVLDRPTLCAEASEETKPFEGAYVTVPDILSNLKGGGRKSRFVKLALTLEMKNKDDAKVVNDMMPHIIDQFTIYLRDLRLEDLDGVEGLLLLKKQLLERACAVVAPVQVAAVLFRSVLVQ